MFFLQAEAREKYRVEVDVKRSEEVPVLQLLEEAADLPSNESKTITHGTITIFSREDLTDGERSFRVYYFVVRAVSRTQDEQEWSSEQSR